MKVNKNFYALNMRYKLNKPYQFKKNMSKTNTLFNSQPLFFNGVKYERFNDCRLVGFITDFAHKHNVKDCKELIDIYFDSNYKLSRADFVKLSETFKKCVLNNLNINLTLEEAIAILVEFLFFNTTVGVFAENKLINILNKKLPLKFKCDYAKGLLDTKYGIDIKITERESGKLVWGIQVKPISIQKSKGISCVEQNQLTKTKNEKINVPVTWFYYSKRNNNSFTTSPSKMNEKIGSIITQLEAIYA